MGGWGGMGGEEWGGWGDWACRPRMASLSFTFVLSRLRGKKGRTWGEVRVGVKGKVDGLGSIWSSRVKREGISIKCQTAICCKSFISFVWLLYVVIVWAALSTPLGNNLSFVEKKNCANRFSCVIIWGNSLSWVVYNMQCSNSLSCSVWYFELSFSPLIESWSNLSEESAKPQQPVVSSGKLTTHNFLFINSYWNCVEIDIKFFLSNIYMHFADNMRYLSRPTEIAWMIHNKHNSHLFM